MGLADGIAKGVRSGSGLDSIPIGDRASPVHGYVQPMTLNEFLEAKGVPSHRVDEAVDKLLSNLVTDYSLPPGGKHPLQYLPFCISGAGRIREVGSLPYSLRFWRFSARRPRTRRGARVPPFGAAAA